MPAMTEKQPRSPGHPRRIRDDRGRKVTQLDPVSMHVLRQSDVIDTETLHQMKAEIGVGWPRLVRLAFFVAIAFIGICLVAIGVFFFTDVVFGGGNLGAFAERLWYLVPTPICPLMIWFVSAQVRFKRIRSVMIGHGRCPHCGYDLAHLPADPTDGATVCPECGCAWKLEEPSDG
jgi:hypothetical protein